VNALQAQNLAQLRHAEASAQTRKVLVVRAARAQRRAVRAARTAEAATARLVTATS
jgi:hypothetical protein